MATDLTLLQEVSIGDIAIGSSDGRPDHVRGAGSKYTQNDDSGHPFLNNDGSSTGWTSMRYGCVIADEFGTSKGNYDTDSFSKTEGANGAYTVASDLLTYTSTNTTANEAILITNSTSFGDFAYESKVSLNNAAITYTVSFCYDTTNDDGYELVIDDGGTNNVTLNRLSGGTPTQLDQVSETFNTSTFYTVRVERYKGSILIFIDGGDAIIDVTDSTFSDGEINHKFTATAGGSITADSEYIKIGNAFD